MCSKKKREREREEKALLRDESTKKGEKDAFEPSRWFNAMVEKEVEMKKKKKKTGLMGYQDVTESSQWWRGASLPRDGSWAGPRYL